MTETQFEKAIGEVQMTDLSKRDVTGGMNGYPTPYLGAFIFKF